MKRFNLCNIHYLNNKIIYCVSITLLTIIFSCGNKEKNVSKKLTLDNCPVIAQVINLQGDPVTNLDFSSVKDTFNLPLSSLLSSFQVIRLENSEDALTAAGQDTHIAVSDHYILVGQALPVSSITVMGISSERSPPKDKGRMNITYLFMISI